MSRDRRGLAVAVIGATGLVGRELLRVLEKSRLPIKELIPFSSGTKRVVVAYKGRVIRAPGPSWKKLAAVDLAFMVSSDEVAARYGPGLAERGVWVIDNSSAFRLAPGVPLVIPEVNAADLSPRRRLIAGPNCTITGAAVAGYPLAKAAGARAVRMASYQAVSGAGTAAVMELLDQNSRSAAPRRVLADFSRPPRAPRPRVLPRTLAANVFPQVGGFGEGGNTSEEIKAAKELRKLWGLPSLPVSATAVRVPALRGHSLSLWLETDRPLSPDRARKMLRRAPGVRLWPEGAYPTPRDAHGTWPVHVGRVRRGTGSRELCLWVVMDNLLKGAALNSAQIAEALFQRGWLRPRLSAPK